MLIPEKIYNWVIIVGIVIVLAGRARKKNDAEDDLLISEQKSRLVACR